MIYTFGDYLLDTNRYQLRRAGVTLRIEPKAFDLLAYLTQHHDQLITKETLFEVLWPNQSVSEWALANCIKVARQAVGDSGRMQQVIETVRGRGYRFIAPINAYAEEEAESVVQYRAEERVGDDTRVTSLQEADRIEASTEPECYETVENVRLPAESVSSQAEWRQITVLSCRVVASAGHELSLSPEERHEILQDVHAVSAEVLRRYEGHIVPYLSDEFLVYFGYPQAHEDDARRAVYAALHIVAAAENLKPYHQKREEVSCSAQVGIHTGAVVMESVGRNAKGEPWAVGDTPHLAIQLQGFAMPNSVMMSAATFHLVEGYFTCQAIGTHLLGETSQPLAIYQVLQACSAHSHLEAVSRHGLTPFVGRKQEIGLLRERWEHVQEGTGQVVLLSGEPGIGKSRLVQTLQAHLANGPKTWLVCRCLPYYQHSALYPVIDLVRQLLQFRDDASPGEKLRKLEAALASHGFALEDAVPLLGSLLSLPLPQSYPPLTLTPQQQKQATLEIVVAWLLEEAGHHPMCLVIEDLHWVDPSTLEWLNLFIQQVPMAPMLTLLTFRPDYQPPWAIRSHLTHLTLSRLPRSQVEMMVRRITRGKTLPAEVLEQLITKTDGVPLFVEELTKMFLEPGFIKEHEGDREQIDPRAKIAIPKTLRDLLMARLDRTGTAKPVAQLGATIGREFAYPLIQAVSPVDETTLQNGLSRLVEAELLYQQGLGLQAKYHFKHVLIQEAAYASLLRRTRQQYHDRIAQALAGQFAGIGDAQPEIVAYHYTEAGQNHRAITYWQKAGQRAIARSAYVEAVSHFTAGLKLLESLPETRDRACQELALQLELGPALMIVRGFIASEVEALYARARELSHQLDDTASLFQALRGLCRVYHIRRELRLAQELVQSCLDLAQDKQAPTELIEAHKLMGILQALRGELVSARTNFEHALALYDPSQHRQLIRDYGEDPGVVCLTRMAYVLWQLGAPGQAHRRMQEAIEMASEHEHRPSLAYALNHAARLYQLRGEPQIAYDHTVAAISMAETHGLAAWYTAPMAIWLGWSQIAQGHEAMGLTTLHQGLAEWERRGMSGVSSYFLAFWAKTYGRVGDAANGQRVLAEAFRILKGTEVQSEMAHLQGIAGELLLIQGVSSYPKAEACFQEALSLARQQQAKSLELRAAMGLGQVWLQHGKKAEAHRLIAHIYNQFTEGFDTADMQDAKRMLAALG